MSDNSLEKILEELSTSAKLISQSDIEQLSHHIAEAKRVFIAGAGRSGFMVRAFSNRLMHLGYTTYFVGEPTTPSIQQGDLLIIGSGSGETSSLLNMAQKAKSQNAAVVLITIYPESSVGQLASFVVKLPGATKKSNLGQGTIKTVQPLGSLFEQLLLLTCESVIFNIKATQAISDDEMFARHANLE